MNFFSLKIVIRAKKLYLSQMDASKNSRIAFLLYLGSITAIGPLAIDMYLPALKSIAQDLNSTMADTQFSLTSFFVGIALGQFFYGPIVDRYGKRKPLLFGISLYLVGSLLCTYSINNKILIIARFIQALGGASGMVISRVIVRDQFDKMEAAKIFSMLMLIIGVAPILAPSLGTFLNMQWGWKSIFYFLTLFSFFILLRSFLLVTESKKESRFYSKKHFLHELKMELCYFREVICDKSFIIPSLSGALMQSVLFAYIAGSAYLIMNYFKLDSRTYSLLFASNAVALIGCAQVNAKIISRFKLEQIFFTAQKVNLILAALLIIVAIFSPFSSIYLPILMLCLGSLGFTFPNSTALALAHTKHVGRASALLGTIQFTLAAVASSLVNTIQPHHPMAMAFVILGVSLLSNIVFMFYRSPDEIRLQT